MKKIIASTYTNEHPALIFKVIRLFRMQWFENENICGIRKNIWIWLHVDNM